MTVCNYTWVLVIHHMPLEIVASLTVGGWGEGQGRGGGGGRCKGGYGGYGGGE